MAVLKAMAYTLDAWLWRQGIVHPGIMPVVRNEILLTATFLLFGGCLACSGSWWFFWFGAGSGVMTLTMFSLARFFLRTGIGAYTGSLLVAVLWRWLGRLLLLACMLYVAFAVCEAPVTAILSGLTCAIVMAFATFVTTAGKLR